MYNYMALTTGSGCDDSLIIICMVYDRDEVGGDCDDVQHRKTATQNHHNNNYYAAYEILL